MHWLQALDVRLFRFINETLSNPVFDAIMPVASGQGSRGYFFAAVILGGLLLLWKGGSRGRICALLFALIIWPGDSLVCNTIKHAVARPRPFVTLADVHLPGGKNRAPPAPPDTMRNPAAVAGASASRAGYNSMPSSHAANWFAATMVLLVFYRRSVWFMLPLASLVAFSRVYNGVHYPSDVIAGAILGAGYAAAGMWAAAVLWNWIGRRWFPLWWETLPVLLAPNARDQAGEDETAGAESERGPGRPMLSRASDRHSTVDAHWLRLGYLWIGALLAAGLAYLASGTVELSGDEAYQWVWSKHLALSYYSKPPLIAYTQFLGTTLWGDTEFGVRFFSPVIGAVLGFLLLRFFARAVNARAGFFLLLIMTATPLLGVGTVLMTVDPLSVLFWTAAMIAGWRAVQAKATTADWFWVGCWMGLGFLSKYTALFQWLSWLLFFVLWKPARAQLRRPGPYLALVLNLVCAIPVWIWNQQHGWITVRHVAEDGGAGRKWVFTLRYLTDFITSETLLLNPVFVVAAVWAAVVFWRRFRNDPRLLYFFSMAAPPLVVYLLLTIHSRVLPNWIVPSVIPLFCLMVTYWDTRFRLGAVAVKGWLTVGLAVGLPVVVLLHDTNLVQRIAGKPLPPKPDPLTRVRGYAEMAKVVEGARDKLLAEGKPVFVIAGHYGTAGLLDFYLPEAKTNVASVPLVYFPTSDRPVNQFYFWPGYREQRGGQNAVFVRELGAPPLVSGWFFKWLDGETNLLRYEPKPEPPPDVLSREFDSVTDLGLFNVFYRGRVFHTIQLFECRHLR